MKNDFATLLNQWSDSLQVFLETASRIPVARQLEGGVCGEWSPKAVLSHLAGWENLTGVILQKLDRGEPVSLDLDVDAENERFVQERTGKAYGEIIQEIRDDADRVLASQKELNEHVFGHKTALTWLQIMAEEYQTHGRELGAWVEG